MKDPEVSNAIGVIHRNSPASQEYDDKSFVGRLDDECIFDSAQYRLLEAALVCLSGHGDLAAETDRHVFQIYRRIALAFACHRDPNDGYCVENLDTDKLLDLMNRIDFVFQCYFDRTVADVEAWDDDAYAAALAEAKSATPNPRPDWLTRGKSIQELVEQLGTFDDVRREVRISFDMGATHYPVGLIGPLGEQGVVLMTEAATLEVEAGAPKTT